MNNLADVLPNSTSVQKHRKPQTIGARFSEKGIVEPDVEYQHFTVAYEYPIYFTHGVFSNVDNLVLRHAVSRLEPTRRHKIVVIVDKNVVGANSGLLRAIRLYVEHHDDVLDLLAPPRLIEGGEQIKDDHEAVLDLQLWLHDLHIDRQCSIIVIGGGSILDMAGFAAATSHRGIRTIRIPTTVLSQNDSGVGVKTAINAFGAKNYLGTFTPPFAVINDFHFISTLPQRDRIAGMAEAIKVATIRDREFFDWLSTNTEKLSNFDSLAMQWMIRRCAVLHSNHISTAGDPFEFGSARPLDFGHWAAHKLESLTHYALCHGEAVAIGVALDSRYAVLQGLFDAQSHGLLCKLIEQLGLKLWHESLDWRDESGSRLVLQGIAEFREHLGGELTLTIPTAIGESKEIHELNLNLIDEAIDWLKARAAP